MEVLIADDDPFSRSLLESALKRWGHEVRVASDGTDAWQVLQSENAPQLAILDWVMPGLDGPEVCRRVRESGRNESVYLILLTARTRKEDIVAGLDSGADDYVIKPFDANELRSRLRVGERVLDLQRRLGDRVRELETALAQVKQLKGLLPICAYCKKVRDDRDYWQQVEEYLAVRTDVQFSHGICPTCWKTIVEPSLPRVQ